MSYYSGIANSLEDIAVALLTHAVADMWTATANTSFTASISSNVMTVSAISNGSIQVGEVISGAGVTAGTTVTGFLTGAGGVGTYSISVIHGTVASGTITQPGRVLSKNGTFFRLGYTATNVTILGGENNLVANPAPNVVSVGRLWARTGQTTREITYPCNYEVFGFAQELYMVINYDVDSYQWMAFGKTTVPGIPGQGGWCGATMGAYTGPTTETATVAPIRMDLMGGGLSNTGGPKQIAPALFWYRNTSTNLFNPECRNVWVNSNLDSHGWKWGATADYEPIGARAIGRMLSMLPNGWNSETVLLPIRGFKERESYKASLVADLQHARYTRVDNHAPGAIITIGSDKWKLFPFYRKDLTARDAGTNINHTGTLGWAIRYEGP